MTISFKNLVSLRSEEKTLDYEKSLFALYPASNWCENLLQENMVSVFSVFSV